MYFVSFGTIIFGNKTLQLPVHLSKLIMNEHYLRSTGFKSIRVGLIMHGPLFKNRHFVRLPAKDSLKLNNTIKTCLKRLNIILYYFLSLNTCECLICQIYQ